MLVKGGQYKTIILRKDLINKLYTASFYINQDLSISSLLTILLKIVVNSYITVLQDKAVDVDVPIEAVRKH